MKSFSDMCKSTQVSNDLNLARKLWGKKSEGRMGDTVGCLHVHWGSHVS